ncbi:SPAC23C11.06c [Scenedesmus sp. PABB004]|nr:SPAC23C11.06c [Scenedesmus sp. PABB004]
MAAAPRAAGGGWLAKACEGANFITACACTGGFVAALVHAFARTGWWGNTVRAGQAARRPGSARARLRSTRPRAPAQFGAAWICLLGVVLAGQSFSVYRHPGLSAGWRAALWQAHAAWMGGAAAVLVVAHAAVPSPCARGCVSETGWWALAWGPPLAFLATFSSLHRAAARLRALRGKAGAPLPAAAAVAAAAAAGAGGAAAAGEAAPPSKPTVHVDAELGPPGSSRGTSSCGGSELPPPQRPPGRVRRWLGRSCLARQLNMRRARARRDAALRAAGWASVPVAAALAGLLALQAAWSAADHLRFEPRALGGQQYVLPIEQTPYNATLFLRCVGPPASPLAATFVLEAGAGAPGATLFDLQDALTAAGRRSCTYDRLGLGWSDDWIMPGHLSRPPATLAALLAAGGEAGPFVLVGHGTGGQLALQFAAARREDVAGVALLDSYSATARHLALGVVANRTDIWGTSRYEFRWGWRGLQLAAADVWRAASPLGAQRFASLARSRGSASPHAALVAALYGGPKAWQGAWGELASAAAAWPDSVDEQLVLAAPGGEAFWCATPPARRLRGRALGPQHGRPPSHPAPPARHRFGTGWPHFGPLPVLVAPSAASVADAGCDITQPGCAERVAGGGGAWHAKQALAYAATLSANASLVVVPGDASFPQRNATGTASLLVAAFGGV